MQYFYRELDLRTQLSLWRLMHRMVKWLDLIPRRTFVAGKHPFRDAPQVAIGRNASIASRCQGAGTVVVGSVEFERVTDLYLFLAIQVVFRPEFITDTVS